MDIGSAPEPDNRSGPDRRRRPTPPFSRFTFFGGRRRTRRRTTDPEHYYVDRLGAEVWLVLLLVFLFQILDANLTLALLRKGGIELNPIMARLIEHNVFAFYLIKLGISAVGLWFLGIHKNFPWVRPGLAILFLLFLGVIGWHCYLIFQSL
ncbi:MAG: hypothetical protein FJY88_12375 [Candidatus Eisenbacteria bacterium]|nr:hypothetical protein [Candidatus Eisenbacteria bacterium]